jgi:hypothetical protein
MLPRYLDDCCHVILNRRLYLFALWTCCNERTEFSKSLYHIFLLLQLSWLRIRYIFEIQSSCYISFQKWANPATKYFSQWEIIVAIIKPLKIPFSKARIELIWLQKNNWSCYFYKLLWSPLKWDYIIFFLNVYW